MNVLGNDYNKPYKKSARVVGDVIGKYHPHGDSAIYDTVVRMAQDFAMRYLLVEQSGDDALHLYLPALGKVRRVNSAGPDGQIAGTTLDVSDLRLISQLLSASSISRDRATRWHDRAAQVLRFSPTVADSPYRRVLATVDEQTCVVVRAEFQDAEDTVKTYQVEPASLRQAGRYWYASRGRLHDHRLGSNIDLSLGAVRVDRKPPSRSFDPSHFHKVD